MLNTGQQPKFQAMREQARRRIIEQMGSEMLHKVQSDLHWNG